jgi:hypothetical protein
MNGTKKTLTTLSAAAALALGGIAIAQTTTDNSSQAGASLGSSQTTQNSDTSTMNNSNDTSTLGAGSSTLGSDSSTASSTASSSDMNAGQPVAQADRG